jgi:hypothetical protein
VLLEQELDHAVDAQHRLPRHAGAHAVFLEQVAVRPQEEHRAVGHPADVVAEALVAHQIGDHGGVLGGVRQVVERAIAHERAGVHALDRDLPSEHPVLVLGDQLHVGAQRVQRALHLGEHRPRDLGDHRQAEASAHVPAQRGLAGGVAAHEVDAHEHQRHLGH